MNPTHIEHAAAKEFDTWAHAGRAESMAKGHRDVTGQALDQWDLTDTDHTLDVGCGNGWVVREVLKNPIFNDGCGIDGAKEMIDKANKIDPLGSYKCLYID